MGRKVGLTERQILVIGAIIKRGRLYDGSRMLGCNLFGENGQARGKVEQAVKFGLVTIGSIFDSIDENGDFPGSSEDFYAQKDFLKEVKKSFTKFADLQEVIQEFLTKDKNKGVTE